MLNPMLLIGSIGFAAGDDGCSEYSIAVDASYDDGACVQDELDCPEPGGCLSWFDLVALVSESTEWQLTNCGARSEVAHRAERSGYESAVIYDFDIAGNLVGAVGILDLGTPWCCDGQDAYVYEQGLTGGTCLPEDTGDASGGCSGCASTSAGGMGAASIALLLVSVRRRARGV
jgi:hypothetical protein